MNGSCPTQSIVASNGSICFWIESINFNVDEHFAYGSKPMKLIQPFKHDCLNLLNIKIQHEIFNPFKKSFSRSTCSIKIILVEGLSEPILN